MSKLYHLESMSSEDLEREFDRLDQERRLRAVARRQAHRVNRDPAEDQTDWDAEVNIDGIRYCGLLLDDYSSLDYCPAACAFRDAMQARQREGATP